MFGEERLVRKLTIGSEKRDPEKEVRRVPQTSERGLSIEGRENADDMQEGFLADLTEAKTGKSHEKPESAISKIEEKEAISDKLKPKIEYVDSKTGYRVRIYVGEAGFDGSLDVYLPGDTMTIEKAMSTKNLKENFKSKLRSGKKSALVIVEGKSAAIRGADGSADSKKTRYDALARAGAFSGLVSGVSDSLGGGVRNINLIGHSRGGSAIDRILKTGDLSSRITTISCLDSTYWDASKLINYAKRGGSLNIAFTLKPEQKAFLKRGGSLGQLQNAKGETAYIAMKVVKGLGLKEISKNHWRSDDGKVNVICDPGKNHRGIAQGYVGEFMGSSADGVSSNVASISSTDQFVKSIEYNGEHLDEFLTKLEDFNKDPSKLQAFLDWAAKQTDMDVLRRANVLVGDDIKDHYLKHLKLSAAFLKKGVDVNEHASFDVDFGGNALAEWNIGAGHMLPFSVKAICVYGKNGEVLFPYAERKTVNGRVGYYVPDTNQYAYIHTGYKIEVLGARDIPSKGEQGYEDFKAEREVFAQDGDRFVVQDYVQQYFRDKLKLDIDVDTQYIGGNLLNLKEALAKNSPDWWEDYLSEKFTINDFFKVFDAYYSQKLVLYKNVLELVKQDEKIKAITLSELEALSGDEKFKKLGEKPFSAKELVEFKAKDLEGKELNEFVKSSPKLIELLGNAAKIANERNPESFVKGRCEQAVRQVTARAIELAAGKPVGSMDHIRIRATNIEEGVTKTLRGKTIKSLTMADFNGLKPGLAIYMASKDKYDAHGKDIKPGTAGRLPVINDTDRHWVMWDGVGFTDNWGIRRSLGDLKRLAGAKNRVVVNVHDPLGQYGAYA